MEEVQWPNFSWTRCSNKFLEWSLNYLVWYSGLLSFTGSFALHVLLHQSQKAFNSWIYLALPHFRALLTYFSLPGLLHSAIILPTHSLAPDPMSPALFSLLALSLCLVCFQTNSFSFYLLWTTTKMLWYLSSLQIHSSFSYSYVFCVSTSAIKLWILWE